MVQSRENVSAKHEKCCSKCTVMMHYHIACFYTRTPSRTLPCLQSVYLWSMISFSQLNHRPYSHVLALVDYFLFPKLKKITKGNKISGNWQHQRQRDVRDSERWLCKLCQTIVQSCEKMYYIIWNLFRNMINNYVLYIHIPYFMEINIHTLYLF